MSTSSSLEDSPLRSSKCTLFLDEPPACILISPMDPSLIVIGTYEFNPHKEEKRGSVMLYRKSKDNSTLEYLNGFDTHAIFDMKFAPHDPDFLATTQNMGCLQTFRLNREEGPPRLESPQLIHCDVDTSLLYLTWHPTEEKILAYTLSTGGVVTADMSRIQHQPDYWYQPHSDQVWTCEWSHDGRIVYSGADDSVLNAQDIETRKTVWKDSKTHQAGVTAIMARPDGNTLITGSYDDNLRVFDLRTRGVVGQINLEGGVWRLNKRGDDDRSIVASCMYKGTRVVDLGADLKTPSVVARFEENQSMNYGSDTHPEDPNTIVSCSFYDKRVSIWEVQN